MVAAPAEIHRRNLPETAWTESSVLDGVYYVHHLPSGPPRILARRLRMRAQTRISASIAFTR